MLLILVTIFTFIAITIHAYIFYLEVIIFGSEPFRKIFKTQTEHHSIIKATFNNLGIYNLALALFALIGLVFRLSINTPYIQGLAMGLLLATLGTMVIAGVYLFATAKNKRKPALIQMMPALLALICLFTA